MDKLLFFIGFCILVTNTNSEPLEDEGCLMQECDKAIARITQNLDDKIDPCEDFYQFACGGVQRNAITPAQTDVKMKDGPIEKLEKMLIDEPDLPEPKIFQSIRNLYKSCMDIEDIEKNSLDDVKMILKQVGGYPVVEGENWDESAYNPFELDLKLNALGLKKFGTFFSIRIGHFLKHATYTQLSISQGNFPDNYNLEADLQYYIDVAKLFGAPHEIAEQEMRDVMDFIVEIHKIKESTYSWGNQTEWLNNARVPEAQGMILTIKELSRMCPNIQWVNLINKYLDNENKTVDENEVIVSMIHPEYLKDVASVLANTSARVLANFQITQSIDMKALTKDAQAMKDKLDNSIYQVEIESAYQVEIESTRRRENTCLMEALSGNLEIAFSSMYAQKYFHHNGIKTLNKMTRNIFNEFETKMLEIDWMNSEAKIQAIENTRQMQNDLIYPEQLLNSTLLDYFYNGLTMLPKGFFKNLCRRTIFLRKKKISTFREPVDKESWTNQYNARFVENFFFNDYQYPTNYPVGILEEQKPLYMQYGAIGLYFGFGSNMIRGFDHLPFFGALTIDSMPSWWDSQMLRKYLDKNQCLIEKYGNVLGGQDGNLPNLFDLTLQPNPRLFAIIHIIENIIPDARSVSLAYSAYQRLSTTFVEPDPVLLGLSFNQNQSFWVAGADAFCSAGGKLGALRINGQFSLLENFSKDWNCPLGSKMNPVKKCRVW